MRPGFVIQAADLYDWVPISAVVDELSIANIHAGVRDLASGRAEKYQVTGLKSFAINRSHAGPCRLPVRIARHIESARAQ